MYIPKDFPFSCDILHDMLTNEWSHVSTHKVCLVAEGGQNLSAQVLKGGGKNILHGCRGGHGLSASNFWNSIAPLP